MKAGVYRVNVLPDQDQTLVTVRKGSIAATGQGPSVKINAGQQVRFQNKASMQHAMEKAPPPDGFDDWDFLFIPYPHPRSRSTSHFLRCDLPHRAAMVGPAG